MEWSVRKWELLGILFISCLGAMLHFVFEWSGEWAPVGVIAAINESVWEHLKIAFWPALIWAGIEYRPLKDSVKNFTFAKAAGIYVMPLVITGLFYAYTSATGREILAVDIVIFVVAIALGQLASYRILISPRQLPDWSGKLAVAGLISLAVLFIVFTFNTPHTPLFLDPGSGTYGL